MKRAGTIKKSNRMLAGAGVFLVLMLLACVITARVVFDKSILPQSQDGTQGYTYIYTHRP